MPTQIQCPHCKKISQVPKETLGKRGNCKCGMTFIITPFPSVIESAEFETEDLDLQPATMPKAPLPLMNRTLTTVSRHGLPNPATPTVPSTNGLKFCTECGQPLKLAYKFCPSCGYNSEEGTPPSIPKTTANVITDAEGILLVMNGKQSGPFTKSQIQSMWSTGQVTADAICWKKGMTVWVPITTLDGIAEVPPPILSSTSTQRQSPSKSDNVTYDRSSDTFHGTMQQIVKLAMRAIQELGWKLDNVNDSVGLITFQTGMSWGAFGGVTCSLNIDEIGRNEYRVTGTGKQNLSGGQLVALNLFDEAKGKAQKAIARMKMLLVN